MHQQHADNKMIVKLFVIILLLVLSSISIFAQDTKTVKPKHLLYISIKGTDNIILEDMWVAMNRKNHIFPITRFAEEFSASTCKNKYYYEVKTGERSVYFNYFCPKGTLFWDGELTIKEDIGFKQDTTDLMLPFFEQADSIDVIDQDGNTVLSIPLKGYGKSMTEADKEVTAVLVEPTDQLIQEQMPETEESIQHPEQDGTDELDEFAIIKISAGLLLLVILIAIFIARIKNAK